MRIATKEKLMTKQAVKKATKQPAKKAAKRATERRNGLTDDNSPIIVGCNTTGLKFPLSPRIQRLLAPTSLYIRHKTFSGGPGGPQVTNQTLKVYNVGSTKNPYNENSPIDQNWSLDVNGGVAKGGVTIKSDDNVTVSIQTNLAYHMMPDGVYIYLIFPQKTAILSAELNGVDLWALHKKFTIEVDFYVPPGGDSAARSKRSR
jgi:hypothetical protein